ncbi:TlpA family protein disulfide reductase [Blastococcus capsensis]|uniref:TlpA family protein disulfide reductase n=1 Tax=Blastococcus capsensis TaxID=1564163 RepID=UPI002541BFA7|nr:redoxin domain-containing protein [Blastococcus capsensis]MDK3256730.1 redoxin domain-containing protein [Blastococcus capsensis]
MSRDRRAPGRLICFLAALALVSAGCTPGTGSSPASPGGGTVADGRQQGAATVLALSGTTVDGGKLDAAELAATPLVLWFWAPWCTVCRAEAPEVAEVAAEYAGRVEVLGVAGRGDLEAMRAFVDETGTGGFRHLVDEDGSLWQRFGVIAQPAFVFVAGDGTTESFLGSLGGDQLRAMVEELDRE